MDSSFNKYFSDEFLPSYHQKAEASIIDKYKNILPDNLVGIWELQGWSGYFNGLFWCVNPDVYSGILEDWLDSTELKNKGEYYVIAKSGFGDLLVFERNSAHIFTLNSVFGFISANKEKLTNKANADAANRSIVTKFVMLNKDTLDVENNGVGIFENAFNKLGHLKPDEIYGFEPLLSLGGEINVDNLSKVKDIVHLSIIRQFVDLEVKYF